MNKMEEKHRLDNIADWYYTFGDYTSILVKYSYYSLEPFFKGEKCLELACGDGIITRHLVKKFKKVIAIDGSAKICKLTRNQIKAQNLKVICSLIENFAPKEKFDTIIMAHILEHVENPILILKKAKFWLADDGVILICVPNANSIHRQLGVKMGLLKEVNELNETDLKLGHRRIYTWNRLEKDILDSKLKIKEMGGVFFKPVSNYQMMKWFSEKIMEGLYELGKDYPKISCHIYAVCEK